jgi:hypothetical protein
MTAGACDVEPSTTISVAFGTNSGASDDCEDQTMADDDDLRQPETVSKSVADYLDMTRPRPPARTRRPPRRDGQEWTTRPPIDNRGLTLEEGNDFA